MELCIAIGHIPGICLVKHSTVEGYLMLAGVAHRIRNLHCDLLEGVAALLIVVNVEHESARDRV